MFWNCQGVRSKRKELELYPKENNFDIVALNETFLTKKIDFKIQGYDTIKSYPSIGVRGGVAFLVKHGLVFNKEDHNADFNIITDNEALAIDIDLSNNQNLILATIYCPNGNPNLRLFETINNVSDSVIFVGDFNSKLEAFGCSKKKHIWSDAQTIQNQLNLIYLNTDEHTHLHRYTGNTDILHMAFILPNLSKHGIQFLIGVDLGSDHLPIEIGIDRQPHRNIHIKIVRYKFNQSDREVFEPTLEASLSSGDVPELKSTQDIIKYAAFITSAISTAVDKAIPKSKSGLPESQPILDETLALIKEKRKLRRQYSQAHDPLVKTRINQL